MKKITTNLWFDTQAEEAVDFYVSIFKNSRIGNTTYYGKAASEQSGLPVGSVLTRTFEIEDQEFVALNGGPIFKFTPAVSFLVACKTKKEVDELWGKLFEGGSTLMELGEYPFSEKYGWLMDKYGLSWQIMFMGNRPIKQKIIPTLMFVGNVYGKTEEAINFYSTVFHKSKIGEIMRYEEGEEPDRKGTIKHVSFNLEGQEFAAMDSARKHNFTFNEAISFVVNCKNQEEVDYYWEKLTKGGDEKAQVCGWLKDKYGVSWQIVPTAFTKILLENDPDKLERVMEVFLKMKKIIIKDLMDVYKRKIVEMV